MDSDVLAEAEARWQVKECFPARLFLLCRCMADFGQILNWITIRRMLKSFIIQVERWKFELEKEVSCPLKRFSRW